MFSQSGVANTYLPRKSTLQKTDFMNDILLPHKKIDVRKMVGKSQPDKHFLKGMSLKQDSSMVAQMNGMAISGTTNAMQNTIPTETTNALGDTHKTNEQTLLQPGAAADSMADSSQRPQLDPL